MPSDLDWPSEPGDSGAAPGIDLKRVLWGRKWLWLFFAAVGAALGYIQYQKLPATYQSRARILVSRQMPKLQLQGVGTAMQVSDPLASHIEMMRTPLILAPAAKILQSKPESTFANRDPQNVMATIANGLGVYRTSNTTDILDLTFTSGNYNDCEHVLNAVIEAYQDYIGESQKNRNEKIVTEFNRIIDELMGDIKVVDAKISEFRRTAKILFRKDETINLSQERMTTLENARAELAQRQAEISAEVETFENALTNGTPRDVLMLTAQQFGIGEDGVAGLNSVNNPMSLMLTPMVQLELLKGKYGAKHPEVQLKEREIEVTRNVMQQMAGEYAQPNGRSMDLLEIYLESRRQEIITGKAKQQKWDEQFKQYQEEAKQLSYEETTHNELTREKERLEQVLNEALRQVQELGLVKDTDALAVTSIEPPSAGYRLSIDQNRYLGTGALLGALLGIALSFLLETADKSFRSPEDISRQLRLPVIGHIPRLDLERGARIVKDKVLDKSLATYHRPKSRVAESFRGVRTALLFGAKSKGLKVVQVTSPDPGDGKSTLSANTAIALANSGKKVLLIDADLRKPKQHKLFGLGRDLGISSVLTEDAELSAAVKQVPVPNLDVLAAGPRTDHPGELILDPKFEKLLETAREQYDMIIIDSPPVLAVTDASAIAPLADGVLLVFRISKRSRPHATQARETMEMIGAKMLGIVVNGLSDQVQYGYEYGKGGGYGAGSHYGYGRGYYYGSDDYYEAGPGSGSGAQSGPKNIPDRRRIDNGA